MRFEHPEVVDFFKKHNLKLVRTGRDPRDGEDLVSITTPTNEFEDISVFNFRLTDTCKIRKDIDEVLLHWIKGKYIYNDYIPSYIYNQMSSKYPFIPKPDPELTKNMETYIIKFLISNYNLTETKSLDNYPMQKFRFAEDIFEINPENVVKNLIETINNTLVFKPDPHIFTGEAIPMIQSDNAGRFVITLYLEATLKPTS